VTFCQHARCASNREFLAAGSAEWTEIHEADPAALLDMLGSVPEFRKERGREYSLTFILSVCVVAALAGAENYREIATVVASISQQMLRLLGVEWNYFRQRYEHPRRTTIWLALTSVDAGELDRITGKWLLSQARRSREDDGSFSWVVAVDGKVMRGAWTDENEQVTLFSAMLHREAITIAQVMVPGDTNEITQVKALAKECGIRDGESVLATLDAAHANRETTEFIAGQQGWDYLITVKTDKVSLYRKASGAIIPVLSRTLHDIMTESARGCTKIWSCWTADASGINFPHLRQVACIAREIFNRQGEKICKEVAIKVTSAGRGKLTAADLNRHARNHWGIENKSHYVRDTVFREDHNQSFKGNGPQTLASLHNLAIGLLRLKGAESIRETMQMIQLDRELALGYMTTERNVSYVVLPANGPAHILPGTGQPRSGGASRPWLFNSCNVRAPNGSGVGAVAAAQCGGDTPTRVATVR
jgi:predicted transposase YbfD/YdcC